MDSKELVQYYHSSLLGWLRLRVSSTGVRAISFVSGPSPDDDCETNPIMTALIHELDLYFSGASKSFSVPLDPATGTAFQRKVWSELTRIPYGETRSYGEIAAAVGNPQGARAVGLGNKNNCIPILIPCHRVIKSDGGLGGYDSGLDIKKGTSPPRRRHILKIATGKEDFTAEVAETAEMKNGWQTSHNLFNHLRTTTQHAVGVKIDNEFPNNFCGALLP